MNALLLVDLQNDFLPGGALAVAHGDEVIAVANRLSPAFPVVIATQDWHPANHLSFAANHAGKHPGDHIDLAGLPQILWPVHCVQETHGSALAAALDATRLGRVVRKGTDRDVDSYSAFFDNGRRRATDLHSYLQDRGVTALTVLGLATDYCVRATALDARSLGWTTTLVTDGCRGVELTPGDIARALTDLSAAGVTLTTSETLLDR